jgi:hypothetical protein
VNLQGRPFSSSSLPLPEPGSIPAGFEEHP